MKHPLEQFRYCPKCGSDRFLHNDEKSNRCADCGFVYYFNPSSSVACFIINPKNELLLVRRAKEPAKGTMDLPGGFVDMYETAEDAVRREVEEETGLRIFNCRYLFSIPNIYPYSSFDVHTLDMFFLCEVPCFDGALAADDASDIVILPISELKPEDFGLSSISKAVERVVNSHLFC
jgi:ADP-ribose pyrophosphatase YjhB (NUDIX family)